MGDTVRPQPPSGPPRARLLLWLIGVPILFVAFGSLAMCLGVLTVVGARVAGVDQQQALITINRQEQTYFAQISPRHPVRWLSQLPERLLSAALKTSTPLPSMPDAAKPFAADVLMVTAITLRRGLAALGLLVPLSVVFMAAISDGMAQRELRKYGADPESALLFREARFAVTTTIGLCTLIYVLCPTALHPHAVLSVIAPISGFALALAVTRFKKYL